METFVWKIRSVHVPEGESGEVHPRLSFRFASLCDNSTLLDKAFSEAEQLLGEDPELERQEHQSLRDALSGILAYNLE